ncbi:hypothetical protein Tco_0153688 [Tanacetum coccineum]
MICLVALSSGPDDALVATAVSLYTVIRAYNAPFSITAARRSSGDIVDLRISDPSLIQVYRTGNRSTGHVGPGCIAIKLAATAELSPTSHPGLVRSVPDWVSSGCVGDGCMLASHMSHGGSSTWGGVVWRIRKVWVYRGAVSAGVFSTGFLGGCLILSWHKHSGCRGLGSGLLLVHDPQAPWDQESADIELFDDSINNLM